MTTQTDDRARHRGMILDPYAWPHLHLPLKRPRAEAGMGTQVAVLLTATTDPAQNFKILKNMSIFGIALDGEAEEVVYQGVDALLDDGWIVD